MTTTTTTTVTTTAIHVETQSTLEKEVLKALNAPAGTVITNPVRLTHCVAIDEGVVRLLRQHSWGPVEGAFAASIGRPKRFKGSPIVGKNTACSIKRMTSIAILNIHCVHREGQDNSSKISFFAALWSARCRVCRTHTGTAKLPKSTSRRGRRSKPSPSLSSTLRGFLSLFQGFENAEEGCEALLENSSSIIEVAQLRIDALTVAFVRAHGKFLTAKCLDRSEFPCGDRDALSKAMTTHERFTAGGDSEEEERHHTRRPSLRGRMCLRMFVRLLKVKRRQSIWRLFKIFCHINGRSLEQGLTPWVGQMVSAGLSPGTVMQTTPNSLPFCLPLWRVQRMCVHNWYLAQSLPPAEKECYGAIEKLTLPLFPPVVKAT